MKVKIDNLETKASEDISQSPKIHLAKYMKDLDLSLLQRSVLQTRFKNEMHSAKAWGAIVQAEFSRDLK